MPLAPLLHATYTTPVGDLEVVVTPEDGIVRSSGFSSLAQVLARLTDAQHARGIEEGEDPVVGDAVRAWSDGEIDAISAVPVEQQGAPFAQDVWAALRTAGPHPISYGELAELVGRPRAARAVGTACGHNAIGLFVPCHRVIQSGGRLGSYGYGGTAVKAALLAHEGAEVKA